MRYFDRFASATCAGSANQHFFRMNEGEARTGRVLYKINTGGSLCYSLLFSNIIDSTYADGSVSHANLICDEWKIHSARVGKCTISDTQKDIGAMTMADGEDNPTADICAFGFYELTFDGKKEKMVKPGEFFYSDGIELSFKKGEYLCLEVTFSGKMLPYHEESMLPIYIKKDEGWEYSRLMPLASMVGCDRGKTKKIAFLGDSITQGIGPKPNSYLHWNSLLSEMLGDGYAYWNLGIGYGRASDAVTDGAWLYKAKQNDIIFVCFGVNDIVQGQPEQTIKKDLDRIVTILKALGKTVILQTVPPFNYKGERLGIWQRVNEFIKTELACKVDYLFDCVPTLSEESSPEMAIYGGHPNEQGSRIWAEALFNALKK